MEDNYTTLEFVIWAAQFAVSSVLIYTVALLIIDTRRRRRKHR